MESCPKTYILHIHKKIYILVRKLQFNLTLSNESHVFGLME